MACFTDLPYANWSYQLLLTLNSFVPDAEPVSLGCFSASNTSDQLYQFYKVLHQIVGTEEYLTQNCFVQLTEPQQWDQLNDVFALLFPPVITSELTLAGTETVPLSYQITATNNPTSFNATSLPAGLSVNTTTGLISGTPTTAGTYNVTISATNSAGTGSAILVITIAAP